MTEPKIAGTRAEYTDEIRPRVNRPGKARGHPSTRNPAPLGSIIYVSEEAYDALVKALDEPAKEIPALRKLLEQKPPFYVVTRGARKES